MYTHGRTSHDALWRPLGGPWPFLHPFPVETRWTNQITSFSLSRFSLFFARYFSPLLTPPDSLAHSRTPALPFSLSPAVLSPRRPAVGFLSSSLLLSPHYPTHNRMPRARKKDATRLSLRALFLWCLYARVPVCGFQLKHRSHSSLRRISPRSLHAIDAFVTVEVALCAALEIPSTSSCRRQLAEAMEDPSQFKKRSFIVRSATKVESG